MKNTKKLNILFTSDTHGWLLPINYADNSKSKNGLSVLANAIKDYSKENSILIDLGDTIQGSTLMYFHHLNREKFPNPAAQILNRLNYDYFISGNHDFNYGMDYLNDFVNKIKAKTLCANISDKNGLLFKQGYEIINKNSNNQSVTCDSFWICVNLRFNWVARNLNEEIHDDGPGWTDGGPNYTTEECCS
jgi:2',3'-cyclic-nucleotide 2'-phosphodiesterase/3'-nucleotidase